MTDGCSPNLVRYVSKDLEISGRQRVVNSKLELILLRWKDGVPPFNSLCFLWHASQELLHTREIKFMDYVTCSTRDTTTSFPEPSS